MLIKSGKSPGMEEESTMGNRQRARGIDPYLDKVFLDHTQIARVGGSMKSILHCPKHCPYKKRRRKPDDVEVRRNKGLTDVRLTCLERMGKKLNAKGFASEKLLLRAGNRQL